MEVILFRFWRVHFFAGRMKRRPDPYSGTKGLAPKFNVTRENEENRLCDWFLRTGGGTKGSRYYFFVFCTFWLCVSGALKSAIVRPRVLEPGRRREGSRQAISKPFPLDGCGGLLWLAEGRFLGRRGNSHSHKVKNTKKRY